MHGRASVATHRRGDRTEPRARGRACRPSRRAAGISTSWLTVRSRRSWRLRPERGRRSSRSTLTRATTSAPSRRARAHGHQRPVLQRHTYGEVYEVTGLTRLGIQHARPGSLEGSASTSPPSRASRCWLTVPRSRPATSMQRAQHRGHPSVSATCVPADTGWGARWRGPNEPQSGSRGPLGPRTASRPPRSWSGHSWAFEVWPQPTPRTCSSCTSTC